jgi:hypothetical protein
MMLSPKLASANKAILVVVLFAAKSKHLPLLAIPLFLLFPDYLFYIYFLIIMITSLKQFNKSISPFLFNLKFSFAK